MSNLCSTIYAYASGFASHDALVTSLAHPNQLDIVFSEHFELSDTLLELLYLPSLDWFENIRLRSQTRQQLLQSASHDAFQQYLPLLQDRLLTQVASAFPAVPSPLGTLDLGDGEDMDSHWHEACELRAKHATRALPPWTSLGRDELLQHPSAMAFLDLSSKHHHLPAYMHLAGQDLLCDVTDGLLYHWCINIFQEHQDDMLAIFSPMQLRCTFDMAVVAAITQWCGTSDIDAMVLGQVADWLNIDVTKHSAFQAR